MTFKKITQVKKSQKDHMCGDCSFTIHEGDSYENVAGVDEDGRFYAYKRHGTDWCKQWTPNWRYYNEEIN